MAGDYIRNYRFQRRLTLSETAKQVGITKKSLIAIEENPHINPPLLLLDKIAKVLDVPVDALLHDETQFEEEDLSEEWIEVVKEAMESDVTKEQFSEIFDNKKDDNHETTNN